MLIVCFFLALTVLVLLYKCYQFSIMILEFEESIEDCLDVLNDKYQSLSKLLSKEIFFDSIEVRQAISDIKQSHDAVLSVAYSLTKNTKMVGKIEEKNSKENKNKED